MPSPHPKKKENRGERQHSTRPAIPTSQAIFSPLRINYLTPKGTCTYIPSDSITTPPRLLKAHSLTCRNAYKIYFPKKPGMWLQMMSTFSFRWIEFAQEKRGVKGERRGFSLNCFGGRTGLYCTLWIVTVCTHVGNAMLIEVRRVLLTIASSVASRLINARGGRGISSN